jgi:hypothetical protein
MPDLRPIRSDNIDQDPLLRGTGFIIVLGILISFVAALYLFGESSTEEGHGDEDQQKNMVDRLEGYGDRAANIANDPSKR